MSELISRFRILPLLVLVAMAAFAVRIGETVTGFRSMAASAIAAEEGKQEAEKKPDTDKEAKDKKAEEPKENAGEGETPKEGAEAEKTAEKPKVSLPEASLPEVWADPAQEQMADTPEQMRLMEDLAQRRQKLDAREKTLDTREAMMKAAEKQIEDKLAEMAQLKTQIEQLLGQQDVEENNRIRSLVKIYEGMKPKDAANIFNEMDMAVLLKVISRMSERKAAPIIAAMDTAKANRLTVQLTEMRKLPEMEKTPEEGGPTPTEAPAGSAELPGLDALGQP